MHVDRQYDVHDFPSKQ